MNDVNVQFLFGNMADFVQMYKIICICQLFFVPLHAICVQGKKTIAKQYQYG